MESGNEVIVRVVLMCSGLEPSPPRSMHFSLGNKCLTSSYRQMTHLGKFLSGVVVLNMFGLVILAIRA